MRCHRSRIIACSLVAEELEGMLSEGMEIVALEFGLHDYPERLRVRLQEEINRVGDVDVILLGYGLCSMATVGLISPRSYLVLPRMHDCIGIIMGSLEEYSRQMRAEPGTYYLTKGWVNHGGDPRKKFLEWEEKYGTAKARRLLELTIGNYTRLAYIQTGNTLQMDHVLYAQEVAHELGLRFEKIKGNRGVLEKMVAGNWDKDFVVVEPGKPVILEKFC